MKIIKTMKNSTVHIKEIILSISKSESNYNA